MASTLGREYYEPWASRVLIRRQNPGGYSASITRCLYGFAGSVDLTPLLDANKKAVLKLRVGSAVPVAHLVDFSSVVDPAFATVAEVAAAVQAAFPAASDYITVTQETAGDNIGRLKIVNAHPFTPTANFASYYYDPISRAVQVYGDLAAALEFGGCAYRHGYGCYFIGNFKDYVKSCIFTRNWDDDTAIEDDNQKGSKVSLQLAGRRGDATLDMLTQFVSNEWSQVFNGGIWLKGDGTPENPEYYSESADDETRDNMRVDVHSFVDGYQQRKSNLGSGQGWVEEMGLGGIGHYVKDQSAGAIANGHITLTFSSVLNPNYPGGERERPNPEIRKYSNAAYDAADIESLLVEDWDAVEVS
jgi:hypothetical protein